MQSQRLPGKPLRLLAGVPLILRVADRVRSCKKLRRIIVATDSPEVWEVVQRAGIEACMTSHSHRSGSDRVAEVAQTLPDEFILNVQGDEPLLPLSTLERLIDFGVTREDVQLATPRLALHREAEIINPNVVKVVVDREGRALYFSRSMIPYRRESPLPSPEDAASSHHRSGWFKHVGIYLYRRRFLLEFVRWAATPLETSESLEQLRVLEHGFPIHTVEVTEDSLGVDTPEDLAAAEAVLIARGEGKADIGCSARARTDNLHL